MASTTEVMFSPQPGDIILLQSPTTYADGTFGPLVKIYKDNFFFASGPSMTSKPPRHTFKRGERILRLFKLYQNWEFVSCKTHKLHLYYPGIENDRPWHLVKTLRNKDHLGSKSPPKLPHVTQFTHLPPSKLFCGLSNEEFSPRLRDIIIRTVPPESKTSRPEKCASCKKSERDALYWSPDANLPVSVPFARDFDDPTGEPAGCDHCRLPASRDAKSKAGVRPWANRWELEHWSETFQPRRGDILVRCDIDTQYGGQFKKTHLQVELFAYVAREKLWKYLGMDVADFGPAVQIHDIVYRPQPGDIIISKRQNWCVRWDPHRHVGGWTLFYKDLDYFGDSAGGQNLWQADENERSKAGKIRKTPIDSWLVRLGSFDEYWDFHLNDRADVFAMHSNGKTMLLHYSTDYPHMGQPPQYKYKLDEKEPLLMSEVEVEPNHWDLVLRGVEKVHEDPLKTRDWKPDPHHWMRDPTLWGRDLPPRFDKEVELYTYWSGFSFEDKDLLLRAGFALMDDHETRRYEDDFFFPDSPTTTGGVDQSKTAYGPPNPSIPPFHTNGSIELYQVRVDDEESPPKFLFLGRDQFSFPDEYAPEPSIEYALEEEDSPASSKKHNKVNKGVVAKDGESGGGTNKGKKVQQGNQEANREANQVIIVKAGEGDRKAARDEATKKAEARGLKLQETKSIQLTGGNEVALP